MKKKYHSIEKLHHFRCDECDRWWSVSDANENHKDWYCTWCGKLQSPKKKQ